MISLEAYISLFLTPLPAFSSATVPRFRLRAENKEMSYIPTEELKKYRVQVEEGVELVRNCAKVLEWTDELKSEYTNKFIHLEKTLGRLYNRLRGIHPFRWNTGKCGSSCGSRTMSMRDSVICNDLNLSFRQ